MTDAKTGAGDFHLERLLMARLWLLDGGTGAGGIATAARLAGLSPSHFGRLYSRTFRETPHATLRQQRIRRAKRLLTDTELPITEICFECGYESLGSFSHLFRQLTGDSPREFRRRRRSWAMRWAVPPVLVPMCLLSAFR